MTTTRTTGETIRYWIEGESSITHGDVTLFMLSRTPEKSWGDDIILSVVGALILGIGFTVLVLLIGLILGLGVAFSHYIGLQGEIAQAFGVVVAMPFAIALVFLVFG